MEKKQASGRNILKKLIPGILFGFLVLLVLVLLSDIRQVGTQVARFNWRFLPAVLGFTLFNYALRFLKWHYYLGQIGVKELAWQESLRLFVAGFPLAVTPGKVGEALKGVWLNQKSGAQVGRGISVVVAERISDGLAVLLLSTFGVAVFPQYWPAFLFVLLVLMALIVVSQIRPLALWILGFGEKLPLIKRFMPGIRDFYEGSFVLFRPRATLLAVGLGTISWLGEGIGFYLILLGLGLPTGMRLMALAVFVLSFSTVVGAASALPGGLGAAEASIAGLLYLVIGEQPALASTATLLIRLATLWFGVSLGLVVWTFSPGLFRLEKSNENTAES